MNYQRTEGSEKLNFRFFQLGVAPIDEEKSIYISGCISKAGS